MLLETEISAKNPKETFNPGQDAARLALRQMNVPRIGVRFRLPESMELVAVFGRGPLENYWDRKAGYPVDV